MPYISDKFRVDFPVGGKPPSIKERRERTTDRIDHRNTTERRDNRSGSWTDGRRAPNTPNPSTGPTRHNLMFGNFADAEAGVGFTHPGGSIGASWSDQDAAVYELEMASASLFISPYKMSEKSMRPSMPGFGRPGLERPRLSGSMSGRTGFFIGLGSREGFAGTGGRLSATFSVAKLGLTVGLQHSSSPNGQSFSGVFLAVGSGNTGRVTLSNVQTRTSVQGGEVLNLQLDRHIQDWILNASGRPFLDTLPDH